MFQKREIFEEIGGNARDVIGMKNEKYDEFNVKEMFWMEWRFVREEKTEVSMDVRLLSFKYKENN